MVQIERGEFAKVTFLSLTRARAPAKCEKNKINSKNAAAEMYWHRRCSSPAKATIVSNSSSFFFVGVRRLHHSPGDYYYLLFIYFYRCNWGCLSIAWHTARTAAHVKKTQNCVCAIFNMHCGNTSPILEPSTIIIIIFHWRKRRRGKKCACLGWLAPNRCAIAF